MSGTEYPHGRVSAVWGVFVYARSSGEAVGMNKETRERFVVDAPVWLRVRGRRTHLFSAGRGQLMRYRDGYAKLFSS